MTQNIYDSPAFFAAYSQLPRSRHGLAAAPEWPSLQALLPAINGKRILDLGCGYGWFSRWAAAHGAARVLALDVSERMLERARSMPTPSTISYRQADLHHLALPESSFDLAFSSLTFHYIEDLPRLFAAIHASLAKAGQLVFSIEHPIYMAPRNPGWQTSEDGRKTWPLDSYQDEGRRVTDWLAKGVVKYHRTLGTLLNTLIRAGFTIRHVEEWGPSEAQVASSPELADERERPMLLLVSVMC